MNNTNMSSEKSLQLEVNNTMNTILTSITDEEKMRISLLSAALKKYSPIKLPGGNKSQGTGGDQEEEEEVSQETQLVFRR